MNPSQELIKWMLSEIDSHAYLNKRIDNFLVTEKEYEDLEFFLKCHLKRVKRTGSDIITICGVPVRKVK